MRSSLLATLFGILLLGPVTHASAGDPEAGEYDLSIDTIVDAKGMHVSKLTLRSTTDTWVRIGPGKGNFRDVFGTRVTQRKDGERIATITVVAQTFAVGNGPMRLEGFTWHCRTEAFQSSNIMSNSVETAKNDNELIGFLKSAKAGRYKQGVPLKIFTVDGLEWSLYVSKDLPKKDE